jgi:DNA-directed RNA polymerase specialized sigma24 family protein
VQIQEPDLSILLDLVRKSVLRRWGWHSGAEDILAEGLMGAWQALTDCEAWVMACAHPGEDPHCRRVARRGGLSAAIEWLRGPQNQDRRVSRRGHAIPRSVSVEALAYEPATDDFSEALVERIAAEEWTEQRLSLPSLSEEDRELLRRTLVEGEALTEAARALGLTYGMALKRRRRRLLETLLAEDRP